MGYSVGDGTSNVDNMGSNVGDYAANVYIAGYSVGRGIPTLKAPLSVLEPGCQRGTRTYQRWRCCVDIKILYDAVGDMTGRAVKGCGINNACNGFAYNGGSGYNPAPEFFSKPFSLPAGSPFLCLHPARTIFVTN